MKKTGKRTTDTEQCVENSAELFQMALDALTAHVAVLDESGNIIAVNEAWRRYGKENGMLWPEFGVGENYPAICDKASGSDADEASAIAEGIRKVLSGEAETYYKEYPCHGPNTKRWFQVRFTRFQDAHGVKVVAAHESVTELRTALEAVRANQELFRAVFEGADDLIFIHNLNFLYTRVNPAVEKVFELTDKDIVGRRAGFLWGEDEGRRIEEMLHRVVEGETIEHECRRSILGAEFTFQETIIPLRTVEKEIMGICVIVRDISDRPVPVKKIEAERTGYRSEAMRTLFKTAARAAAVDSVVLLLGESGAGKDHLARWIHEHSTRNRGPFFSINCAAISHELAESELFGHESGAFTGARIRKRGLLELAEGGTLLLNEIGELSSALQAKLLTFLDTKTFLRVGGDKHIKIDARLIAATHRDLEVEVAEGRFLDALFYRLNVFLIRIPSLRERLEDLPVLVKQILPGISHALQRKSVPAVDKSFLAELRNYSWPGNIRELRNVLERALIITESGTLKLDAPLVAGARKENALTVSLDAGKTWDQISDEIMTLLIRDSLGKANQNAREAAKRMGISRDAMYRNLKRLGISPPQRKGKSG